MYDKHLDLSYLVLHFKRMQTEQPIMIRRQTMGRHQKSPSEKDKQNGQRRREMKALRRSFSDMCKAWAGLGVSIGTSSLRGVVEGMRATAEAIADAPNADSPKERTEHAGPSRGLSDLAATWAHVGLAMGKTALEKSADGLEVTADTLDKSMAEHQEPSSQTTSDILSDPDET